MQPSHSRPYRSHKYPACGLCRKRKVRCIVETPGGACRLCIEKRSECSAVQGTKESVPGDDENGETIRRYSKRGHDGTIKSRVGEALCLSRAEASLLLNQPMAEDITVVEKSMNSRVLSVTDDASRKSKYQTLSKANQPPMVSLRVPRLRIGRAPNPASGSSQLEIIEQILGDQAQSVLDLFYSKIYPCFPVIKPFFSTSNNKKWESIALHCVTYAISSFYWSKLKHHGASRSLDMTFLWNQAVSALHEEYLAPDMHTIQASLLAMLGRPTLGVQDNILDCGRAVSLAQGLGLHRNPSQWDISTSEKYLRIRIWWGLLIHDTWSSLAHGTPPLIQTHHSDVPLPSNGACMELGEDQIASSYFMELCKLTDILTRVLPLIYRLTWEDAEDLEDFLKVSEDQLGSWESQLADTWKYPFANQVSAENGSSGLWFCYLILKLLVSRLDLKRGSLSDAGLHTDRLRIAAINVAFYVSSLSKPQLNEFWFPYTAHLLVSSTTMLLRCTIECRDNSTKIECIHALEQLKIHLKWAKEEQNWELGDFTLDRCGEVIEHVVMKTRAEGLHSERASEIGEESFSSTAGENTLPEEWQLTELGPDPFGFLWDHAFEPFAPWRTSDG